MTDRTYGIHHHSLDGVQELYPNSKTLSDLVAHIRELQAENAALRHDKDWLSDNLVSALAELNVVCQKSSRR
jgi:hypothetical protein